MADENTTRLPLVGHMLLTFTCSPDQPFLHSTPPFLRTRLTIVLDTPSNAFSKSTNAFMSPILITKLLLKPCEWRIPSTFTTCKFKLPNISFYLLSDSIFKLLLIARISCSESMTTDPHSSDSHFPLSLGTIQFFSSLPGFSFLSLYCCVFVTTT